MTHLNVKPPADFLRTLRRASTSGTPRSRQNSILAYDVVKQEDAAKKRVIGGAMGQIDSIKSLIGMVKGVAGGVVGEGVSPESKLDKIASLLDSVTDKFRKLEMVVKDCLEAWARSTTLQQEPSMNQMQGTSGSTQNSGKPLANLLDKLSSCLHLGLESLLYETKAERGHIYLYSGRKSDDLQVIATVGTAAPISQSTPVKVPVTAGMIGNVFTTGVAVNQGVSTVDRDHTSEGMKYRTNGVLCMPLQAFGSAEPIGVVQLLNKHKGATSFTSEDENDCYVATKTLSYMLRRYPVDWFATSGNPLAALSAVPCPGPSDNMAKDKSMTTVWKHESRRLVYRVNHSGQCIRQKMQGSNLPKISPSATLIEVDAYIKNLEECWKRSVSLNIDYESTHDGRLQQLRNMREESRKDKSLIHSLQDTISMHTDEYTSYKDKIDSVKHDLQRLVDAKYCKTPGELAKITS
eukprot:TRINITY_DN7939_c0_g1_i1.p1 TRINITY_DN7939_c0_g1~~TRINITY_DN7939_c0_g1_i1.p1  ORF type:complete len:482 (+),score=102.16 TRINITY_DN7939_c0_g1_i1:59-1447(+)